MVKRLLEFRRNNAGVAAVEFGLIFPVLLLTTFAILEFAIALLDRHQASESLRRFTRSVAIIQTNIDLSAGSVTCTVDDAMACNSSVISTDRVKVAFDEAHAIFPRLRPSNISVTWQTAGLEPNGANPGIMALVTVSYNNLDYKAKILPGVSPYIQKIIFPKMSMSLITGG
jgi:Flp pilus assembly protein TadG